MSKWYGSLDNRLEENKGFDKEIHEGAQGVPGRETDSTDQVQDQITGPGGLNPAKEEIMYKVVCVSGSVKHTVFSGMTYEEALEMCNYYGWVFDWNGGLVWDLEIEED